MMKPTDSTRLVQEQVGNEMYEYYPLGTYVVMAPGVCGGRPTFKRTRLEVAVVLTLLANGMSSQEIIAEYEESNLSQEAIQEAMRMGKVARISDVQVAYYQADRQIRYIAWTDS
ncbi:MAG: DUF433 domain-containing protein [Chloroflexota bacterium]|jgi:uncharacterized protein (DUF433 family)